MSGNNDFFGPELGEEYLEILDGGAGKDILIGDNGDTLTGGGSEQDDFTVILGGKPVTITDFSNAPDDDDDQIFLMVPADTPDEVIQSVGEQVAANGRDIEISLDGKVVAVLENAVGLRISLDWDFNFIRA